ncbi:RNA polymerase subunit sigma [Pacificitalea manganoxidans]|uniref:RNA polymerase subunit sigma n=1 Tax=Pacificitalea manganoxidans TaxID=1411902 RepID=A0A291LXK8_9RHOB|nr:RNA polymerase sigma factor [Pacificitalea manganoxidans]ATI41431.1 RNA polymerase subunit sigma [Pacificitalea manganoxidans]MAQ44579.1 RNA polymerase subunit sigma [Actibacterium sp.]MDR6308845.1 RNA polymerase sigma-70 factor (ECF subfamily) [Pacificitalea manganoxidans]OWU71312.1 RNA polymerase sigma factor [Roseovarius sp. 22II1-1F6A]|tara:strand:- start:240 stop:818 length:579 start_codon:yes stop_codon:yes gene_type:complete
MPLDAMIDIPDDTLLVLYANGDRSAARSLTLRLTPAVVAQARRMLRDQAEAEDVAQEAMLRLWRIAPDWRPGEAKVTTWLYRVTANLCTDRLRKRRGVGLDQIAEPEDDTPRAEERMQIAARAEALEQALNALPERQREAVALRHIEGWSNPEIATAMDITVEAVESLTARGKRALAALLLARREELGLSDD